MRKPDKTQSTSAEWLTAFCIFLAAWMTRYSISQSAMDALLSGEEDIQGMPYLIVKLVGLVVVRGTSYASSCLRKCTHALYVNGHEQ